MATKKKRPQKSSTSKRSETTTTVVTQSGLASPASPTKRTTAGRALPAALSEAAVLAAPSDSASYCTIFETAVNDHLGNLCAAKHNHLKHCDDSSHTVDCACGSSGGAGTPAKVDLIVLIDCSGSMSIFAKRVSDAARAAIEKSKATCPTDLRVTYLGVDGTWPTTAFTTSHRIYLSSLTSATLSTDNPMGGYDTEEGANAVEDLSKYFDWRKDACRAIFYISDEELDGSLPRGDIVNEAAATLAAITSANANSVTVFAHHITSQNLPATVIGNYNDLCGKTGGKAYFSKAPTVDEYVGILVDVICNACGNKCKDAEIPDYKPCISVSWGDSTCDCLESDDIEVLCITVCNCYSNITFNDLSLGFVYIVDENGKPVTNLPDGSPSVQIIPPGPLCFGDISPCKDGKPGCVSRQVVLRSRGAKGGRYQLRITGVCYSVNLHFDTSECFALNICKD